MKSNDEILDAVYIHGTREKDAPGSRCNIPELPPDELTIATALKMLDQKDRAKDSRIQELEKECADWKQDFDAEIGFRKKDAEKIAHLESKLKSAQAVVEAARAVAPKIWPLAGMLLDSPQKWKALLEALEAFDAVGTQRSGGE